MKRLMLISILFALAGEAWASPLQGKLDLSPSVQPVVARELHDGQWLAGISHPDLWHLDYIGKGNSLYNTGDQVLHAGLLHLWNAEKGNASFGPIVGINLPVKIGDAIQSIGTALGFPTLFKPIAFAGSALSVDGFVGYRPVHTSDVRGPLTYGVAATMTVKFGVSEMGSVTSPQIPQL